MIPSQYIYLDALPLTPTGKLDRKALPVPDEGRPALNTELIQPSTSLEKIIAETFLRQPDIKNGYRANGNAKGAR